MLPEKALLEFKEIYKDEFGVELTGEDLTKTANSVLEVFKVIYRPMELKETPSQGRMKEPPNPSQSFLNAPFGKSGFALGGTRMGHLS